MRHLIAITRALADANRVRLLMAVQKQELCVCQLIELVRLSPATVSKHLSILRQAHLLDSRKSGRWVYYRAADNGAPAMALEAVRWLAESLRNDAANREDRERLAKIVKEDPDVLCRRQAKGGQACDCPPSPRPSKKRI